MRRHQTIGEAGPVKFEHLRFAWAAIRIAGGSAIFASPTEVDTNSPSIPSAASDPARIVGARQGFMLGIAVSALCAIGLTVLLIALPMLAINWTLLLPVSIAVQWWACWRRPSYHHKRALIGYVLGCALAYGVAAAVLMYMFVRALAAITG